MLSEGLAKLESDINGFRAAEAAKEEAATPQKAAPAAPEAPKDPEAPAAPEAPATGADAPTAAVGVPFRPTGEVTNAWAAAPDPDGNPGGSVEQDATAEPEAPKKAKKKASE